MNRHLFYLLFILNFIWSSFVYSSNLGQFYSDLSLFNEKSLSIQNKKYLFDSASTALISKQLFWSPTVSTYLNHQSFLKDNNIQTATDIFGAKAQWNLFQGGGSINELDAAKAQKKASELSIINETLQVEVQASNLIFNFIYLTEIEQSSSEILKLKEETLKITSTRYQQGKLPRLELIKAEVDLNKQKILLREDKLKIQENLSEIKSLFLDKLTTNNWPFNENNLPLTLISFSPNDSTPLIEEKLWLSKFYEERWKFKKSSFYPSLDLNISFEKSLTPTMQNSLNGSLTLSFPLWDQFETKNQLNQSFTDYQIALNDYQSFSQKWSQKRIFLEKKILSNKENLIEAKNNLNLVKKLYSEVSKAFLLGRISVNDLFIEQERLIFSQKSLTQSQLDFHQGLIEYCALLGKKISECIK